MRAKDKVEKIAQELKEKERQEAMVRQHRQQEIVAQSKLAAIRMYILNLKCFVTSTARTCYISLNQDQKVKYVENKHLWETIEWHLMSFSYVIFSPVKSFTADH